MLTKMALRYVKRSMIGDCVTNLHEGMLLSFVDCSPGTRTRHRATLEDIEAQHER